MRLEERKRALKDGSLCILRSPEPEDAGKMLEYLKTVSEETYFMIRYPEEIILTEEKEAEFLKAEMESENEFMINAIVDGELAGDIGVRCVGNYLKMRHRAGVGIAVKKKFWHRGLGSLLIEEALKEAKNAGYGQIELGVFEDNVRARALYEKYGFEEWGRMKRAFKLKDGTYRDEIMMGRFL